MYVLRSLLPRLSFFCYIQFAGLLLLTACSPGLTYDKALSAESCAAEKGIWYAEKCWKPYDDRSVADSDVERFAEERIQALRSTKLMLNGTSYPYEQVSLDISAGEEIITVKFNSGNMQVVVNPQAAILMLLQNDTANPSNSRVLSEDTIDVKEISGALEFKGSISAANEDKSYDIAFTVSEDMLRIGTTRVWADGATAYLEGIPGIITYVQVRDILKQHPEVRKLVIREVKGGFNDPINFNTGRLIRRSGIQTYLPASAVIAGDGLDLFLAGQSRIAENGAKVGINRWCCIQKMDAAEIPADHPAHQPYIEYYHAMLGNEAGERFYRYILENTSANRIRYLSQAEQKELGITVP